MIRLRIILWPLVATAIAFGILIALGSWQLRRKAEKEAMLSALSASLTAVPVALGRNGLDLDQVRVVATNSSVKSPQMLRELTRVTVSGTFLQARSVPVRATLPTSAKGGVAGGIGYFWMTPLQIDQGPVVFINRGFVPSGMGWKAPAITTPEGIQTITGLVRLSENRQMFTPADIPAKGEFFVRDVATMARAVSIDKAVPYFIDLERQSDDVRPPVGINATEMIARIPNNHLQYAGTWFGFALTLLGVFGFFAYGRLRDHETRYSGNSQLQSEGNGS